MKAEVQSAVDFISNLLSKRIPEAAKITLFNESLGLVLCSHYADHWFPEKPFKGSGYRCIRIVNRKMDPLLAKAAAKVDLSEDDLLKYLPAELTLWIDPLEVSYRIGEDGSIGVLYEQGPTTATPAATTTNKPLSTSSLSSSDMDSSDDSSGGSLSSSPSQSQEYLSFQQQACKTQSLLYLSDSSRGSNSSMIPVDPIAAQGLADPMARHWSEYLATFVAS